MVEGKATVKPKLLRQGYVAFRSLTDLDQRKREVQEFERILAALISDLGGEDQATEAQRQLAIVAAAWSVTHSDYVWRKLHGVPVETADWNIAAGTLRRTLLALGLERRAKDVTKTLEEHLAGKKTGEVTIYSGGT
jgi:hypothetical protein